MLICNLFSTFLQNCMKVWSEYYFLQQFLAKTTVCLLKISISLINFWPVFSFYTPWRKQKTLGVLVFSGSRLNYEPNNTTKKEERKKNKWKARKQPFTNVATKTTRTQLSCYMSFIYKFSVRQHEGRILVCLTLRVFLGK